MAVTAAAVKALREKTDLPMMECKKALVEADGDEAKAIEILKEAFKKIQLKRADNATEEGRVFIKVSDDGAKRSPITAQTAEGLPPLALAARAGNLKLMVALLDAGAPVDFEGSNRQTALTVI